MIDPCAIQCDSLKLSDSVEYIYIMAFFRRVPGGWINGAEWHSTNSAGASNGSLKDFR